MGIQSTRIKSEVVRQLKTVAILGNPNSGKSSIFNYLTGLRQKTGNFPGVTVEKHFGKFKLQNGSTIRLLDLPGAYSMHPTSEDEKIVCRTMIDPSNPDRPDAILYVADGTLLEKHLLLFTQIKDLGIPTLLLINMADVAERKGIQFDVERLKKKLGSPVLLVSGRTKSNLDIIRLHLEKLIETSVDKAVEKPFYQPAQNETTMASKVMEHCDKVKGMEITPYHALLLAHYGADMELIPDSLRADLADLAEKTKFNSLHSQVRETMARFDRFVPIVNTSLIKPDKEIKSASDAVDKVVMHRIWGPVIFFLIMLIVFQAIYAWAEFPMDAIDGLFSWAGSTVGTILPGGWIKSLIVDGILAGLGGIFVFIPQIAILFFLISLLEEVGYMARAVYMFDKIMQRFGLNGRSIVALISGGACAIPAIMSTRTISNKKERLITILVTPFISCSARIPVYIVLIGIAIPAMTIWGLLNLQGLVFMAMYLLGIIAALGSAWVFHKILKTDEISYLAIELPDYKKPDMKNVFLNVWQKVKAFLWEAGKVIFVISIILWGLSSFGPGDIQTEAEAAIGDIKTEKILTEQEEANMLAAKKLEFSYAGRIGKVIEPAIEPLGFDWKIGIALLTSFAAREVFVGTMATIYSLGSEDDHLKVRERMALEVNPATGKPIYNLATSMSLLIFYVFAMQCMSTLAVVKRETGSWKWPIFQFIFMGVVAYVGSLITYQLLG